MGDEALQRRVRWGVKALRVTGGHRGDDGDRLIGERIERCLNETVVVLKLRGSRYQHDWLCDLSKPRRRIGRRVPLAGTDHDNVLWPIAAGQNEGHPW